MVIIVTIAEDVVAGTVTAVEYVVTLIVAPAAKDAVVATVAAEYICAAPATSAKDVPPSVVAVIAPVVVVTVVIIVATVVVIAATVIIVAIGKDVASIS